MTDWSVTTWCLVVAGGLLGLYALHRVALRLERDGWIRYLNTPPTSDGSGAAMLGELQKIYEPQTRHVYELKEQRQALREDEAGDDPKQPK